MATSLRRIWGAVWLLKKLLRIRREAFKFCQETERIPYYDSHSQQGRNSPRGLACVHGGKTSVAATSVAAGFVAGSVAGSVASSVVSSMAIETRHLQRREKGSGGKGSGGKGRKGRGDGGKEAPTSAQRTFLEVLECQMPKKIQTPSLGIQKEEDMPQILPSFITCDDAGKPLYKILVFCLWCSGLASMTLRRNAHARIKEEYNDNYFLPQSKLMQYAYLSAFTVMDEFDMV
ncbi:hypothetical protein V8E54_003354 [Elaphomyces granulatus]